MISNSKRVQSIVEIFAAKGIKDIVFSPGSRNAPITISLTSDKRFNCISVVDERSAGFFALGKSLALGKPVVLCCTSGSASLNYSSAISEAYYQNIPLLILTTDRPPEWINHGEGQAINQVDIYKNIIHSSFNLPIGEQEEDIWFTQRSVNEAIINATSNKSPVQINIPFREPLYEMVKENTINLKTFSILETETNLSEETILELADKWNSSKKTLILCGQMSPDKQLNHILNEFSNASNTVILTESTANLDGYHLFPCIDRIITSFTSEELTDFEPELLITIGGAIISKKIKNFLRKTKNIEHWSIQDNQTIEDTYQHLSLKIPLKPNFFFRKLFAKINFESDSNYHDKWKERHLITTGNHEETLRNIAWSDLKAFDIIYNTLPDFCNLHLGNSSPVRYIQLFNQIGTINYYSNRGVSGIDGSTSTAIGFATESTKLNVLISGDLSFMYDINAFWNNYLPSNFRVIVINNSGGGIFRIIPGPSTTPALENFFEVGNSADIASISKAHNLNYYHANSALEIEENLEQFYQEQENKRPSILEIFTPKEVNATVLKQYFEKLF